MFSKKFVSTKSVLILLAVLFTTCGCAASKNDIAPPTDVTETASREGARKTLEKAMEQSKQTGKTVHIDVDGPYDNPQTVQEGDLVMVHYTASLEDGTVFRTTLEQVDRSDDLAKAPWYQNTGRFVPEPVLAGSDATIPGLGQLVLGMAKSASKKATLSAKDAFGEADPNEMKSFPCEKKIPRDLQLGPREFVAKFNRFPAKGDLMNDFNPYLKARILDVTENFARLEILARDEKEFQDPIGTTQVEVGDKDVVLTFTPKIGAPFEIEGKKGQIVYTDGATFTVDFNPPFLGKSVVIDMEVVSFTKASELKTSTISWLENHEEGLSTATSQDKPLVLVLYAGWCGYSKKLLTETMEDPRVKMFKDDFVWAKIDSDAQKEYKELYGQNGFPLTLILDPYGNVLEKIDGYKDAATLYQVLSNHVEDKVG